MLSRRTLTLMLVASLTASIPVQSAQAGPLIDWLFGSNRTPTGPMVPIGSPYAVGYAPTVGGYVPVAGGYPVVSAGYAGVLPANGTAPIQTYGAARPVIQAGALVPSQTLPSNLVPTPVTTVPDYRSTLNRTPVTYYRPVLTTDPNTGAQVVTLSPCSSYEYQTQRVPTWGLTQVFNGGATLPATVVPTAPSAPLMTIPRGGVSLAGPLPSVQSTASYGTYPQTTFTAPTTTPLIGSGSIITPANPSTYAPVPATSPYSTNLPNYSAGYGSYSTLQPGYGGTGAYPTGPLSSNAYSAVPSCGSTGNAPLPSTAGGLPSTITPAGPATITPVYPGSSPLPSTAPVLPPGSTGSVLPPGTSYPGPSSLGPSSLGPGYPGPSLPAAGSPLPSADPNANSLPVLPSSPGVQLQSGAKLDTPSRLRGFTREPINSTADNSTPTGGSLPLTPTRESAKPGTDSPSLMPIPLPADYKDEPRWNPGLLSEQDQTALRDRATEPASRTASSSVRPIEDGSYKPIQWAAYVASKPALNEVRQASAEGSLHLNGPVLDAPASVANNRSPQPAAPKSEMVPLGSPLETPPTSLLRPLTPASSADGELRIGDMESGRISQPRSTGNSGPAAPSTQPKAPTTRSRYSTDGWKKSL